MKAGAPFAVFGEKAIPPRGAVGAIHLDYDRAVPAFAEACKAAGIEEVVEICWHRLMCDVAPGLESAGIRVTKKMVAVDESEGRLIGVKRAGRLAFQAAYSFSATCPCGWRGGCCGDLGAVTYRSTAACRSAARYTDAPAVLYRWGDEMADLIEEAR